MNLFINEQAKDELLEAVRYHTGISPVLGGRFYREIEQLIHEIGDRPLLYREFETSARRLFSDRFPYCVVYSVESDGVCILAVLRVALERRYAPIDSGIKLTH